MSEEKKVHESAMSGMELEAAAIVIQQAMEDQRVLDVLDSAYQGERPYAQK